MNGDVVEEVSSQLEGKLTLTLEDEDWKKSAKEFAKVLVLRLISEDKYKYNGIIAFLRKVWTLRGKVFFGEAKGNRIIARFQKLEDMERVYDGGPWNYGGSAILMSKWVQGAASKEIVSSKLGIWVQFHNVPEQLMTTEETAKKLGRMIGTFCRPDQNEGSKLNRCRVFLDAMKPLVTGFNLERPNKEPLWIMVKYERLPQFCHHCGLWTHETNECNLKAQSKASLYKEWLKALAEIKDGTPDNEVSKKQEQNYRHSRQGEILVADGGQRMSPVTGSDGGDEETEHKRQDYRENEKSDAINKESAPNRGEWKVSSVQKLDVCLVSRIRTKHGI
ncbi:hypothetical protein QQ045_016357 [Rhodiola kirilowii]